MDIIFAEIEFEPNIIAANAAKKRIPSIPAQVINQRAADPIREKFYAMRRLASDNPLTWRDAKLFYKQAKLMENFSDDYPENITSSMYHLCYQHLGYEQLRTYFTWRTRARNGEYPPTSLPYVFIYIYELLSNIGISDPAIGLDKLVVVWNTYREQNPALDKYLPEWLKDYHIYYDIPGFADFISQHGLQQHYPELLLFEADAEHSLDLWNNISSYKITKSKFYSDDNIQLLKECFCAVLSGIKAICAGHNARIDDLFIFDISRRAWQPFAHSLFYDWLPQPDRRVEILSETYLLQDNQWTADISMHHSGRAALAGYIIKKTEACLRQITKFKLKIKADHDEINRSFQKFTALGITFADLDQVIEDSVTSFRRERTRTVVTVNRDNLTRIRDEALGTQEKLIVQEENETGVLKPQPTIASNPGQTQFAPTTHPPVIEPSISQELQTVPDIWGDFRDVLDPTEYMALKLLLNEDAESMASIKALADENGLMLEVLADNINDKAMNHIGDNILEMDETMTIYDEYKDKIAEMMG